MKFKVGDYVSNLYTDDAKRIAVITEITTNEVFLRDIYPWKTLGGKLMVNYEYSVICSNGDYKFLTIANLTKLHKALLD